MKLISSLLIVTTLAAATPAMADDKTSPVVSPVQRGAIAPFTGVLFSPEAIARVVAQQDASQAAMRLAVQNQAAVDAAQLQYQTSQLSTTCNADKGILQAQVDNDKQQINILNDQLKKNTGGPGPGLWIGTGVVGGVIVTLLTVFAVGKATK